MARFAAALAPGSLIAISHLTGDFAQQAITDSAAAYNARVPVQVYPRSRDQVSALCGWRLWINARRSTVAQRQAARRAGACYSGVT